MKTNAITFEEWVKKYFEKPELKLMYMSKNTKDLYTQDEVIRKYNRAHNIK
jgi:hypothetical protein